jgi:hypothetical protein
MDVSVTLGIAIFFIGLGALGIAYNASDAPMEQISETLTGKYTDATMAYFIAGMIAVTIGGFVVLAGRRP